MGGTAVPRKLTLLLLRVRARGRRFDSDLVHQAVSANPVFWVINSNSSRTSGVSADGGNSLWSLRARVRLFSRGILQSPVFGLIRGDRKRRSTGGA
jgi:hypothetical protein